VAESDSRLTASRCLGQIGTGEKLLEHSSEEDGHTAHNEELGIAHGLHGKEGEEVQSRRGV
jgi:hypothetical protein